MNKIFFSTYFKFKLENNKRSFQLRHFSAEMFYIFLKCKTFVCFFEEKGMVAVEKMPRERLLINWNAFFISK
jgi:hypothetical protein